MRNIGKLICLLPPRADIFLSTFLQPIKGSKKSILNWAMKLNLFNLTLLVNFFHNSWKNSDFQDKLLPLQTNDVQAMLLQSEIVSEINLSANWKTKCRDRTKQAVKKLNLCGKTAVDKSAWVKPCHRPKVKLPYDWVWRQANEI